ncbi:MAG: AAA family ATPase [Bacillota bacterium]
MKIYLENVRTFDGEHQIPLRRLTVLTGENSSGKSTLMGMVSTMGSESGFPFDPKFDAQPYNLGSFDTIATFKGGRYGRAKHFTVGFEADGPEKGTTRTVRARYESDQGRVSLANLSVNDGARSLVIEVTNRDSSHYETKVRLRLENGEEEFDLITPRTDHAEDLRHMMMSVVFERSNMSSRSVRALIELTGMTGMMRRVVSVAPIRTRPQRVYSQIEQRFEAAGDHIPFVLDRLLTDGDTKAEKKRIQSALERLGRESGLFDSVSIKKLGIHSPDPFHIMVNVAGRARNLIDVGYGVSQVLPVVVETVLSAKNSMILMQQPEVHLHPRAQAALGTFFCDMVKSRGCHLVLETHSDFILDRIRQEVAMQTIPADWVQILFFHREGYVTRVHPLRLDQRGNVQNAPNVYRDFFFREEIQLLTRTKE